MKPEYFEYLSLYKEKHKFTVRFRKKVPWYSLHELSNIFQYIGNRKVRRFCKKNSACPHIREPFKGNPEVDVTGLKMFWNSVKNKYIVNHFKTWFSIVVEKRVNQKLIQINSNPIVRNKKTASLIMAQQNKNYDLRNYCFKQSPPPYQRSNSDYKPNHVSKPMYAQPKFSVYKGCHHEVNFGKYKAPPDQESETWYGLANKGEYDYIKWCLNTDKIQLHGTTKPHAEAALKARDSKAKWEKKIYPTNDKNTQIIAYAATINGQEIIGPEVKEICCETCQKFKDVDHFITCDQFCDDCIRKQTNNNY